MKFYFNEWSHEQAESEFKEYLRIAYYSFVECVHNVFKIAMKNIPEPEIHETLLLRGGFISDPLIIGIRTRFGNESYECCETCWSNWLLSSLENFSHELGHYLHYLSNEGIRNISLKEIGNRTKEEKYLSEIVAQTACCYYLYKQGLLGRLMKLQIEIGKGPIRDDIDTIAFHFFDTGVKKNTKKLTELVQSDISKASSLLEPYFSDEVVPYIDTPYKFRCNGQDKYDKR